MNNKLYPCASNYTKTLVRLEKSLRSGKFTTYSQHKKFQIWNRLCRYARQLGISIKASLAAACVAAGLSLSAPVNAQGSFTEQTGTANPLDGVSVSGPGCITTVDIDNDGDKDVFIGDFWGNILYYKNTGSASAPVFTQQTAGANPLNGVDVGYYARPAFVDIDNDGDKDVLIGEYFGTIIYYKNTGSAAAPVFTLQAGAANPFNGVNVGNRAFPVFVDIDGDGDMDAFIGAYDGSIKYYKNTGTPSAPVFTIQTGVANPLDAVNSGATASPAFLDFDGDGDMDVFIGNNNGNIEYYKNTGTASVPAFTLQSGTSNPLDGVDVGYQAMAAFDDLDNDGDKDVLIGSNYGTFAYYTNNFIVLPLHLLSFSGSSKEGYNQLDWQTADEINTSLFEIERSSDGRSFTKIAGVNATGSGGNKYSYDDRGAFAGKIFYRLKMVDIDGKFTYSYVVQLNSSSQASVTIYPNPATDLIYINTGNATILNTVANVYDAHGRLMQHFLINNRLLQINIKRLPPGLYNIKFADASVRRFIKE